MMKLDSRSLAILTFFCGTGLWADGAAVRPRPSASTYPASAAISQTSDRISQTADRATVAATALTREEVRNAFATDLNKGYLVFEVAFYPSAGELKISPDDFILKVSPAADPLRPVEPAVVARAVQEKNAPKQASRRTVDIYPVASVGYESGTYNNGTNGSGNNGQRHSGWYSTVGVGVGVGGSPNGYPSGPSTDRDRSTMEAELFDKSLPEGPITKPTAGYLYFPAPKAKQKSGVAYELQYMGPSGTIALAVPVPPAK